ncbi:MAG: response regulator transcription factor [Acidimicrobiales bacterium]
MRVLVIEDDEAIRSVLERGLRAEGFEVDACADGSTGLTRALDRSHAAIVLDLLLPGLTGYKVCEHLRAEGVDTPILVLSAKSGEYDQIDLLDAGADDFLTKPASIELVAARLRALVRRGARAASNTVVRGPLSYDLGSRTCELAGAPVALTMREDQMLRRLLLANGACATRQELLDDVWGVDSGTDATIVDIYLRKLRTKLAPVEIENVRGVGYRIVDRAVDRAVDR